MTQGNRVQRRRRGGESGFTLIELLVVIGILGVLAGIVVFNVTGVSSRGSTAACITDVGTVQAAVDSYRNTPPAPNVPPGDANPDGTLGVAPRTGGGLNNLDWAVLVPNYVHTRPASCASYSINVNGDVSGVPK